jgi:peroxiredoxin Q/BCP
MNPAADFDLPDQHGISHKLSDYRGKWLVIYFYPKDDTPGCTIEACSFRDERSEIIDQTGAEVLGVSKDSVASHKKFADKHHLNFILLSDIDHKIIEAYDSWRPLKFMGKDFMGTERNTFIIDPKGNIAKEYRSVNPKNHANQIIADLKHLQTA